MSEKTPNHDYSMPEKGANDWHNPLNDNFDRLDTDVEIRDVETNRDQYAPSDGAKFLAVDTGRRYLGDGVQWVEAPSHPRSKVVLPHVETDPADATTGSLWYRTDLDEVRTKVGGSVVTLAGDEPTNDAEIIWRMDFNDPPAEASKSYSDRDLDTMEQQLLDLGWDEVAYWHTDDGLDWPTESQYVVEGSHSLAFRFPEGDQMGSNLKKNIHRDEAWAQYWLKFDADFDVNDEDHESWMTDGGKLPGWMGTESVSVPWRAIGAMHSPGRWDYPNSVGPGDPVMLCYYNYQSGISDGNTHPWTFNSDGSISGTPGIVQTGEWYELTLHCRLGTPGTTDDLLEAWVRHESESAPTKAYEQEHDLISQSSEEIHRWRHNAFFGGNWNSPQTQHLYTDDLRIYQSNPL